MTGSKDKAVVQDGWFPGTSGDSVPRQAFVTRLRAAANASLRALGKKSKVLGQALLEPLGCLIYVCRGRLPLTAGYREYRTRYLRKTLANAELLEGLGRGRELPIGFGTRLDERVLEYAWLLARLQGHEKSSRILDAGSSLNYEVILQHPAVKRHKWSVVTFAPETECFWDLGVSYLFEDLRSLPYKDEWFDAVTCISTIEHVGMDNAVVTMGRAQQENRPQDYLIAVREMWRVLRPGGTLFLTAPFGRYEHHGWLQQFDSDMLTALVSEFRASRLDKTFFRYTVKGWKRAEEGECADLCFSDVMRNKHALPKDKVPGFPPDYAVAARAVACIELQK